MLKPVTKSVPSRSSKTSKRANKASVRKTKTNSRKQVIAVRNNPSVTMNFSSTTISHREFVTSLTSQPLAGWQTLGLSSNDNGYDINPCCTNLFPWLSCQAPAWEKYSFRALSFTLVPGNPTTVPGRVYAFVDYDWDDAVPTSMAGIAPSFGLVSNDVWQPLKLVVDIPRLNEDLEFRYTSGSVRLNAIEPRTIFGGYLFVCCQGTTTSCTWDLFVDYTVTLSVPQFASPYAELSTNFIPSVNSLVNNSTYVPVGLETARGVVISGSGGVPRLSVPQLPALNYAGLGVLAAEALSRPKVASEVILSDLVNSPTFNAPNLYQAFMCFSKTGICLGDTHTYGVNESDSFASSSFNQWSLAGVPLKSLNAISLDAIRSIPQLAATAYLALALMSPSAHVGETATKLAGRLLYTPL